MINDLMKQAVTELENEKTRNLLIRSAVEIASLKQKLETTKKQLEDSQAFIHRFQEDFYLNNSISGLSKLYADIAEYDLAKLNKPLTET